MDLDINLEGVSKLLKDVSSAGEVAELLDEYFEWSSYLPKLKPEDFKTRLYLSFNQLACELLEDLCKHFQNREDKKDTRNIAYFGEFYNDLLEDLNANDKGELTLKEAASWSKCFHKQLEPHVKKLKERDESLFSSKLKPRIAWFDRKNFCQDKDPSVYRKIEHFLIDIKECKPEFLNAIWLKLNNLYLLTEVDELLTDEGLRILSEQASKLVSELKEHKFDDMNAVKEKGVKKLAEFKEAFSPEMKNRLHEITTQAVRQNRDLVKAKLPSVNNQVQSSAAKELLGKLPTGFNVTSILQMIDHFLDEVGKQPYGTTLDQTALSSSLEQYQKEHNLNIIPPDVLQQVAQLSVNPNPPNLDPNTTTTTNASFVPPPPPHSYPVFPPTYDMNHFMYHPPPGYPYPYPPPPPSQ